MKIEPPGTYVDMSKALGISKDRYEHIVVYIMRMMKDYQGDVVDIVKEIPLNLKGKERYFSMFMMGHSSTPMFSKVNDEEKEKFIKSIIDALKISQERAESIAHDIANNILKGIEEKDSVPTVDIIKKIIDSDFKDVEKDYIIFTLGLIYV